MADPRTGSEASEREEPQQVKDELQEEISATLHELKQIRARLGDARRLDEVLVQQEKVLAYLETDRELFRRATEPLIQAVQQAVRAPDERTRSSGHAMIAGAIALLALLVLVFGVGWAMSRGAVAQSHALQDRVRSVEQDCRGQCDPRRLSPAHPPCCGPRAHCPPDDPEPKADAEP